jgi:hypothetical protein
MVGGEAREHRGELVDGRRRTLAGTTLPIPSDEVRLWLLTVGRPRVGGAAASVPGRPAGSGLVAARWRSAALARPAPASARQPSPQPANPASLPALLAVPAGAADSARRSHQGAAASPAQHHPRIPEGQRRGPAQHPPGRRRPGGARPLGGLVHRAGAASGHPPPSGGFERQRVLGQRPTSPAETRQ